MQNFGMTNKKYYGVLWYFLEWSISHQYQLTFFGLVTNIDMLCTYEPTLSQCGLPIHGTHVSWCVVQHVDRVSALRWLICQPV